MRLFNTLSREAEVFAPIDEQNVRLFVCGPTVYGPMHLGHAKTYTQFDLLAKVLRREYPSLRYAMNSTDIDDKIINRAASEKRDWKELAETEETAFWGAMDSLGNEEVNEVHRATDFIPQVISQVSRMLELENAYVIENSGVYFDLSTFPAAGNLAHRHETGEEVSRLENGVAKRNAGDFVVWKFAKEGEPAWYSPFGSGRPGWHIEDTAITEAVFGPSYDIHGGATDLIFPHHEAEIAQMETLSGEPLVRYWAHTGLLNVGGDEANPGGAKMGKSKNNFITVESLLNDWDWRTLRYYLLSIHYRSTMNWSEAGLAAAETSRARVEEAYRSTIQDGPAGPVFDAFWAEMLDDLNTPRALAVIFTAIRTAPDTLTRGDLEAVNDVLGSVFTLALPEPPIEIVALALHRDTLRAEKAWAASDEVREEIRQAGWDVRDTPGGFNLTPRVHDE